MPQKLLSRTARLRANGLLDMLYTPAEMAGELGIEEREMYDRLIPAGLPTMNDDAGHVWLHGPAVAGWIRTAGKPKREKPMGTDEAYCLSCRAVVPLVNPRRIQRGKFVLHQAACPQCGKTVNRGVKANDQSR